MTINSTTGRITGTPRAARTYWVAVTATDTAGATGAAVFAWRVAANPCVANKMVNSGFESGKAHWSTSKAVVRKSRTQAHRGSHWARLGGYGRKHSDSVRQTVHIPSGCKAQLTFYAHVTSADHSRRTHDRLGVYINGHRVALLSNRSKRYIRRTASLSPWSGRTVTIRFTATENRSRVTSFNLDDVTLALRH